MEYYLSRDQEFISRRKVKRKNTSSSLHYHKQHEIYYMLEGKTTYFIEDKIFEIEEGNFVVIPEETVHMTDSQECKSNERLMLSFDDRILSEDIRSMMMELSKSAVIYVPNNYLAQVEEILFKIEKEFKRQDKGKDKLLTLYVQELIIMLYRYRYDRKAKIYETDKIVYRVADYINSHFSQDITLEILGNIFAISEEYLSRKFKNVFGIGLNQYLTYVRISHAEKLLRETRLSITEIADRCGYNGSNYFSAVFKRMKGVTPLVYRRQVTIPHEREQFVHDSRDD